MSRTSKRNRYEQRSARVAEEFAPETRDGITLGIDARNVPEWMIASQAAKRLDLTVGQVETLIRDGAMTGEWGRVNPRSRTSSFCWWVTVASFEAYRDNESRFEAVVVSYHATRLDRALPPDEEPCVLYGLLTSTDVAELNRRKAKTQGRQVAA